MYINRYKYLPFIAPSIMELSMFTVSILADEGYFTGLKTGVVIQMWIMWSQSDGMI